MIIGTKYNVRSILVVFSNLYTIKIKNAAKNDSYYTFPTYFNHPRNVRIDCNILFNIVISNLSRYKYFLPMETWFLCIKLLDKWSKIKKTLLFKNLFHDEAKIISFKKISYTFSECNCIIYMYELSSWRAAYLANLKNMLVQTGVHKEVWKKSTVYDKCFYFYTKRSRISVLHIPYLK